MARSSAKAQRAQNAQRAADSIRRLIRGLRLAARRTTRTGVTSAQLYVLGCLSTDSAGSLNDLAQRTLTDRSSVATVVDRLVERGFVTSVQNPDDRRRSIIRITARGRAILKDAPESATAQLLAGLGALDEAELASLATALDRLIAAMGLSATPAEFLFSEEDAPRARRPRRASAER